jgi:RNA polymerase sigma-70 factor (ECF subfamily)
MTDQELARALKKREPEAFEVFYDRFFDPLYKFCFFRLGRKTSDAEDVVSEVLLTAIQKIDELKTDEGTKIYNWLATIARYKLLEFYRRKKQLDRERSFSTFDENFQKILEESEGREVQEEEETSMSWSSDSIGIVMSSLPEDYQQVLTEKYLNGLSVRKIAEIMQRSEKAVESLLTRSRASFRKAVLTLESKNVIEPVLTRKSANG